MKRYVIKEIKDGWYWDGHHCRYTNNLFEATLYSEETAIAIVSARDMGEIAVEVEIKEKETR